MKPGDFVPSQKIGPMRIAKVETHPLFTLTTAVGIEPKAGRPKNTAAKRQEDARWLAFYNEHRPGMSKNKTILAAADRFNVKPDAARSRYRRILPPGQ